MFSVSRQLQTARPTNTAFKQVASDWCPKNRTSVIQRGEVSSFVREIRARAARMFVVGATRIQNYNI